MRPYVVSKMQYLGACLLGTGTLVSFVFHAGTEEPTTSGTTNEKGEYQKAFMTDRNRTDKKI